MLTSFLPILLIGVVVGLTTVLFGFGGGFVTVPVIALLDAAHGPDALAIATATSALVMLVNAAVATAATRRADLAVLASRGGLLALLALGGAAGAAAGRLAPDWVLRWGFVLYIAATIVDLVLRPGFLRPAARPASAASAASTGLPNWLGAPIGALAALLGVGGSVMTVPLMRRSGTTMALATTLANPLTLAIVAPALAVSLLMHPGGASAPGLIGSVDVPAASALLAGAIPVIVLLRRKPPHIPELLHAWVYIALLVVSAAAVACSG